MTIKPIAAFQDNYIWIITQADSNRACVVDPGDASVVTAYLEAHELVLDSILITHHHNDHIGGVETLKQSYSCTVYAGEYDVKRFPSFSFTDCVVSDGDEITLLSDLTLHIMHVPGHTTSHIAYYNDNLIFCGDTLFSAGCGRRFEGTAEQFHQSLQRIAALPVSTKIYCTHEYTLSNIAFALHVEPENTELQKLEQWAKQQRESDRPTLPSNIQTELAINPFLRCQNTHVREFAQKHNPSKRLLADVDVFDILRQQKDHF